jgi:hypothetical protein
MINRNINIIQRIIYSIALIVVGIGIFSNPGSSFFQLSSIGFPYWVLDLVVILPLVYQLIFNNRIGWFVLISLIIIHFVWTTINLYQNSESTTLIGTLVMYLVLAGGLLFILKPRHIRV